LIAITGASGQLGRLVIQNLLATVAPRDIVALVRDPQKVTDLAARRIDVRQADYDQLETLPPALVGVDKLLLISGSEPGRRLSQHRAIIDAAVNARVKLIAYTSILRADTSEMLLAKDHLETERALAASKIPYVLLRNGWYNENHAGAVASGVAHGAVLGAAGEGRFSSAARADYAAAAAVVLTRDGQAGRIYELAGDTSFSLGELAAEIARQSGKPVAYHAMSEADYKKTLLGFGLPEPVAAIYADADAAVSRGALVDDGHELSELIGRATTPMSEMVKAALKP
jgi:NAD(P)H dehydrogenase (quinone)